MTSNASDNQSALVAVSDRIDHDQDIIERKRRELAAAFNRMGSDQDGEANTAFERARQLTQDLELSFSSIYQAHDKVEELREANTALGKQLRQALQENARYRSMNIWYKAKLRLGEIARVAFYTACYTAPLFIILFLYEMGYVRAIGAALLVAPIGVYDVAKGLVRRSPPRLVFGSVLLLGAIIGFQAASHLDSPAVHLRVQQVIDDMNREHEFGPKTFYLDYPLSNATLVMTVFGFKDTAKITVEGVASPLEISCAKYYENSIIVPNSALATTPVPEKPDVFHRVAAATFGPCDLYAEIAAMH